MGPWQRWVVAVVAAGSAAAWAQAPQGEVQGRATQHTDASAVAVVQQARVVLPAAVTAGALYAGTWANLPRETRGKAPVVVFLHGSSGLGLPAIAEWQAWLATRGIASVAPDSFALPERITYKSPVSKELYERIHALRASEITLALNAVRAAPWADPARIVLAGTSEGATAVARYGGPGLAGRMVFAWSCEANYFVERPDSVFPPEQPVLNVISSTDPFFSPSNTWLGNPAAKGHCGDALRDHKRATITLIPGAAHTLLNLPAARHAVAGFLDDVLRP